MKFAQGHEGSAGMIVVVIWLFQNYGNGHLPP